MQKADNSKSLSREIVRTAWFRAWCKREMVVPIWVTYKDKQKYFMSILILNKSIILYVWSNFKKNQGSHVSPKCPRKVSRSVAPTPPSLLKSNRQLPSGHSERYKQDPSSQFADGLKFAASG